MTPPPHYSRPMIDTARDELLPRLLITLIWDYRLGILWNFNDIAGLGQIAGAHFRSVLIHAYCTTIKNSTTSAELL
jgi:hypothetical protein